jgi:hypothetical protein
MRLFLLVPEARGEVAPATQEQGEEHGHQQDGEASAHGSREHDKSRRLVPSWGRAQGRDVLKRQDY